MKKSVPIPLSLRAFRKHVFGIGVLALISLLSAGCGGHKQAKVSVPAPPPIQQPPAGATPKPAEPEPQTPAATKAPTPSEEEIERAEEAKEASAVPADAKPLYTEIGLSSWYGPPYHNRRGSNGEIYNMHAFTAAHRTLPLGTIIRVTNVKTGNSTIVRITDRGPFIKGRILDLSLAAAKRVDVWRAGVTMVKIEVLKTPASLDDGGRWAVQIGGFGEQESANEVADHLSRRYRTAKILCFNSPAGDWWVRVRVRDDDRKRAEEVAHNTQTPQGAIFLVRLD